MNFQKDVMVTIHAFPEDYKPLQTFISTYPHAYAGFTAHGLIIPMLTALSIKDWRPKKALLVKCFRLQAALLYGFFKYWQKQKKHPIKSMPTY